MARKRGRSNYHLTIGIIGVVVVASLSLVLFYPRAPNECVKVDVFGQKIERCALAATPETVITSNNGDHDESSSITSSSVSSNVTFSSNDSVPASIEDSLFRIDGEWIVNGTTNNYPVSAEAVFNSTSANMTDSQLFGTYEISGNVSSTTEFHNKGAYELDDVSGILKLRSENGLVTEYSIQAESYDRLFLSNKSTNENYTFAR